MPVTIASIETETYGRPGGPTGVRIIWYRYTCGCTWAQGREYPCDQHVGGEEVTMKKWICLSCGRDWPEDQGEAAKLHASDVGHETVLTNVVQAKR